MLVAEVEGWNMPRVSAKSSQGTASTGQRRRMERPNVEKTRAEAELRLVMGGSSQADGKQIDVEGGAGHVRSPN